MKETDGMNSQRRNVAPILRAVFPELSEQQLGNIHESFVLLFGKLHDHWVAEQLRVRDQGEQGARLDAPGECDSLKRR